MGLAGRRLVCAGLVAAAFDGRGRGVSAVEISTGCTGPLLDTQPDFMAGDWQGEGWLQDVCLEHIWWRAKDTSDQGPDVGVIYDGIWTSYNDAGDLGWYEWCNAFTITVFVNGSRIWVQAGTNKPGRCVRPTALARGSEALSDLRDAHNMSWINGAVTTWTSEPSEYNFTQGGLEVYPEPPVLPTLPSYCNEIPRGSKTFPVELVGAWRGSLDGPAGNSGYDESTQVVLEQELNGYNTWTDYPVACMTDVWFRRVHLPSHTTHGDTLLAQYDGMWLNQYSDESVWCNTFRIDVFVGANNVERRQTSFGTDVALTCANPTTVGLYDESDDPVFPKGVEFTGGQFRFNSPMHPVRPTEGPTNATPDDGSTPDDGKKPEGSGDGDGVDDAPTTTTTIAGAEQPCREGAATAQPGREESGSLEVAPTGLLILAMVALQSV